MKKTKSYIWKCKLILNTSAIMLTISTALMIGNSLSSRKDFETTSFDIRMMSITSAATKSGKTEKQKKLIEVENKRVPNKQQGTINNVSLKGSVWYLPTEHGRITTYPNYGHVAYDITSPRGQNEIIFPVANGEISGIYTDSAGALIVTVRHYVDGKYYSSQYAHLSYYADIHVGQSVTPNTPLGWMGTTGYSTGVHLHITVLDCNLFGPNNACGDLNGFFRYGRTRLRQGFYGLGSLIYVPNSWDHR